MQHSSQQRNGNRNRNGIQSTGQDLSVCLSVRVYFLDRVKPPNPTPTRLPSLQRLLCDRSLLCYTIYSRGAVVPSTQLARNVATPFITVYRLPKSVSYKSGVTSRVRAG